VKRILLAGASMGKSYGHCQTTRRPVRDPDMHETKTMGRR